MFPSIIRQINHVNWLHLGMNNGAVGCEFNLLVIIFVKIKSLIINAHKVMHLSVDEK